MLSRILANPAMLQTFVLIAVSLVAMLYFLLKKNTGSVDRRLEGLGTEGGGSTASGENPIERKVNRWFQSEDNKEKWRDRLVHAGLYRGDALPVFQIVRGILMLGSAIPALVLTSLGYISMQNGMLAAAMAGIGGTLAPSLWLDRVKSKRQTKLRRALPDALDIMVVCLQGGLSLNSALSRVAREISMAHPLLAVELSIAERQIRLGKTTGEAIQEMGRRFDLEELRGMASAILQAERIGSSVTSALDVFGDTLRLKRHQRAEELAHTASVKILFPTLLCIFPAIFIVILGPAGIQIYSQLVGGVLR